MDNAGDVAYAPDLQPACPPVQVIALPSVSKVDNKTLGNEHVNVSRLLYMK